MERLRIAIVSSPRSGNTWVRSVLATILDLQQFAVHNYLELQQIPERCIVQTHWYREPNFQKYLDAHAFNVLVIARHPLDLLISILNFIRHEPLTTRWLEGNAEIPESLIGQPPTSRAFTKYAMSWGSENVLMVTYQWWHDRQAVKVRYEDLVRHPRAGLISLARKFEPTVNYDKGAVQQFDLRVFRSLPNKHGWQGKPNLWRELMVYSDAYAIFQRHKRIFKELGYTVRPFIRTRSGALRHWNELTAIEGEGSRVPSTRRL